MTAPQTHSCPGASESGLRITLGSLELDAPMMAFSWKPCHGHTYQLQEGLRCSGIPAGMLTPGDVSASQEHTAAQQGLHQEKEKLGPTG